MNKIVSISLVLLVCASMFCAVALNTVSADENYEDHSEEYGDENNPWDIKKALFPTTTTVMKIAQEIKTHKFF